MRSVAVLTFTIWCAAVPAGAQIAPTHDADAAADNTATEQRAPQSGSVERAAGGSFLSALGRDFRTFFTTPDAARTVGVLGAGALFASQWDAEGVKTAGAGWPDDVFGPGQLAGNFLVQLAAGGSTYVAGRVTGDARVASIGRDLVRAQILSQTVVQAAKYSIGRDRPDLSNNHSLPSGHTASAFATAAVLQRHLGWKAGAPAYAFAAYVGASRMAANRHYLSDVVLGAGVGIAAAHTVTINVGAQRFSLGVAPAAGGAAVVLSARQGP